MAHQGRHGARLGDDIGLEGVCDLARDPDSFRSPPGTVEVKQDGLGCLHERLLDCL
jgi:hypothetical protein